MVFTSGRLWFVDNVIGTRRVVGCRTSISFEGNAAPPVRMRNNAPEHSQRASDRMWFLARSKTIYSSFSMEGSSQCHRTTNSHLTRLLRRRGGATWTAYNQQKDLHKTSGCRSRWAVQKTSEKQTDCPTWFSAAFHLDGKKASRLIESAILDIPIPSIYLAEEQDGRGVCHWWTTAPHIFFLVYRWQVSWWEGIPFDRAQGSARTKYQKFQRTWISTMQDKILYYKSRVITFTSESEWTTEVWSLRKTQHGLRVLE